MLRMFNKHTCMRMVGCTSISCRALPRMSLPLCSAALLCRYVLDSVAIAASTVIFAIAAGGGGNISLLDNGMIQTLYFVYFPLANFAVVSGMELWVDFLPSQVRVCSGLLAVY